MSGFIDAHSHPLWGGLQALVSVDTNLGSIARIQDALSARAKETSAGPGAFPIVIPLSVVGFHAFLGSEPTSIREASST